MCSLLELEWRMMELECPTYTQETTNVLGFRALSCCVQFVLEEPFFLGGGGVVILCWKIR